MRAIGIVAVGLVSAALVGITVSRVAGGKEQSSDSPPSATIPLAIDDSSHHDDADPQQSADTSSAVSVAKVAMDAVGLTDEVARAGFISRRDLIDSFTTESFGPELADETSAQVGRLLVELGERDVDPTDLAVVEQPICADVIDVTSDAASVDVWSVMVVAAPGAGPARQVWRTVSVALQQVDGVWLVDGWESTLGPTPALAPDAGVSDVNAVATVIGWSATEGAG